MKKRSRFLQVPIEPFTVDPEVKADELLEKMERISFQGRSLGVAHRVWQKMLGDDVTIFMGMAGALSAGGLRMVVAYLIEHRYIDCLVSTGANLYHDLHETRGRHHYLGSARVNDAALADDRIDRVYDTYASEEEFCDNDVWIGDFVATLDQRPYTSREFLNRLGGHLWKETQQNGILTAAYRAGVPIFCPAIADSSIGMGLSQGRHKRPGPATSTSSATSSSRRTSSSAGRARPPSCWAAARRRISSIRRACRPSSSARRSAATDTRCKS